MRTPIQRITLTRIWDYLLEIINFERGILYTLWGLTVSPGKIVREYLNEDREKMVKPFKFLVYIVAIGAVAVHYLFPPEAEMIADMQAQIKKFNLPETAGEAFQKVKYLSDKYRNVFALLSIPVISLVTYYTFKKNNYNFAEHLVINSYLLGFINVLSILLIFTVSFEINLLASILTIFILLYFIYFFVKVFERPFWNGLGLSFLALLLIQLLSSGINLLFAFLVYCFM